MGTEHSQGDTLPDDITCFITVKILAGLVSRYKDFSTCSKRKKQYDKDI
jgi:hypothetical protein